MSFVKNTPKKTNNKVIGMMGGVFYLSYFKKLNQVIVITQFFYQRPHSLFMRLPFLILALFFFYCLKIKQNNFVVNL